MSKYWSEVAKKIDPYVPGEQPQDKRYIKLNTNENPYPPSPKVLAAINQVTTETLRLYPDPECRELRACIAEYHGLTKEQVFVGNGSDEVLAFCFQAFFNPGTPILFPDISYSFYPVYAKLYNIDYKLIPLEDDFSLAWDKFCSPNGGVIFPNPNAPTGRYMPLEAVETILEKNIDQVVIVDEAYIDFGGQSAVKFINRYPNLLVVQTLSKSRSLAGLRVGLAIGHKDLIEGLERVKNSINSYTLDRAAMAGAEAAFKDEAYFQTTRNMIMATREKTIVDLQRLGFTVIPSLANFIFISHSRVLAADIYQQLREEGILVRYFNKPRINNFLRVSIGNDREMKSLVEQLTTIVR
ncbi:MAG: histidinol-phosphate aminotransferase [Firmicutes bacterium]|nr:histidinol-phosphate aminotransferase [Bacillota bacterium]